jgi:hypothetical protein
MKVKNGSPAAISWIQKLKSSGHLVDIYDFDRLASDQSDHLPLETSDLEGFDEEFGTSYRNHLLAVFIDDELDLKELTKLYPPLSKHFDSDTYTPHLIFINLMMQSLMVVKLFGKGRVGSVMLPDSESDQAKFTELDYAGVVERLTDALTSIAEADYNMVYSEIDEGHIQQADEDGPDADGMYLVGTHGDDGEGITIDELKQAKNELENYSNSLDDGLCEIRKFFPKRNIDFDNFQADY